MANTAFQDGNTVRVRITNIKDSAGNPAQFNAPPTYSSSDASIYNPIAAPDGLSASGVVLKTGPVVVTVTGDGVVRTIAFDVVAGQVVSFDLVVEQVTQPQPTPAP